MKLIWIGSKTGTKEKLSVSQKLHWGELRFDLLGITFSCNLNEMPDLNYSKALGRAKQTLNSWKFRCLTPIGKITVIKSSILSKFTHLFGTLPASEGILNDINKMLFNYLWDSEPDKIKREQISSTYLLGGLKMTNIFNFEKSIKMKWLKIAITDICKHWLSILLQDIDLKKLTSVGSEYCESLLYKLNPFWKAVCMYFSDYVQHLTFKTPEDY